MGDQNKIYEFLKLKIDKIVDARGIIFSDKLDVLANGLNLLNPGEIILIYCSDLLHLEKIPNWISKNGHHLISIIEEQNFYKIIIKKGNNNNNNNKSSNSIS